MPIRTAQILSWAVEGSGSETSPRLRGGSGREYAFNASAIQQYLATKEDGNSLYQPVVFVDLFPPRYFYAHVAGFNIPSDAVNFKAFIDYRARWRLLGGSGSSNPALYFHLQKNENASFGLDSASVMREKSAIALSSEWTDATIELDGVGPHDFDATNLIGATYLACRMLPEASDSGLREVELDYLRLWITFELTNQLRLAHRRRA